jgi:uncharacterized protein (TIGR02271 family)
MRQYTAHELESLVDLDDWELVNSGQDIRGQMLYTADGDRELGIISRMLVDRNEERVAVLVLDNGRAVAVEDVELRDGRAYVHGQSELSSEHTTALAQREAALRSRTDDTTLTTDETGMTGMTRGHAGMADRTGMASERTGETEAIPIVQESLHVGTRNIERGRIMVRSRVVEQPVREEVTLTEEHVEVSRRPVTGTVTNADALFEERTIEVTERGEEAVVGKQARVVEEVVVSKDARTRTETVQDTVRHTEVDVERVDSPVRTTSDDALRQSQVETERLRQQR